MNNSILAVLVNSAVGVFLSGLYFAMAVRVWQRRSKFAAILPMITGFLYTLPTADYLWNAFHGTARNTANPYGLLLLLFPALLVFQVLRWSWLNEADASTIIRDLEDA